MQHEKSSMVVMNKADLELMIGALYAAIQQGRPVWTKDDYGRGYSLTFNLPYWMLRAVYESAFGELKSRDIKELADKAVEYLEQEYERR